MAAAAFKATIQVRGEDGWQDDYPCTVSDVNPAFYIFPDGNSDVVLPGNHGNLTITAIILSAAGTDTSRADIYVNGKNTGRQVLNAVNLGTNYSRQFMGNPMRVAAGSRVRLTQIT